MGKKLVEIKLKWLEIREKLRNKYNSYKQKLIIIRNKSGYSRTKNIFFSMKPWIKEFIINIINITANGTIYFIALTGILNPIHFTHRIFALGLTSWIVSKWIGKIWDNYVSGKIEIKKGEKIKEEPPQEEMIYDMEY